MSLSLSAVALPWASGFQWSGPSGEKTRSPRPAAPRQQALAGARRTAGAIPSCRWRSPGARAGSARRRGCRQHRRGLARAARAHDQRVRGELAIGQSDRSARRVALPSTVTCAPASCRGRPRASVRAPGRGAQQQPAPPAAIPCGHASSPAATHHRRWRRSPPATAPDRRSGSARPSCYCGRARAHRPCSWPAWLFWPAWRRAPARWTVLAVAGAATLGGHVPRCTRTIS